MRKLITALILLKIVCVADASWAADVGAQYNQCINDLSQWYWTYSKDNFGKYFVRDQNGVIGFFSEDEYKKTNLNFLDHNQYGEHPPQLVMHSHLINPPHTEPTQLSLKGLVTPDRQMQIFWSCSPSGTSFSSRPQDQNEQTVEYGATLDSEDTISRARFAVKRAYLEAYAKDPGIGSQVESCSKVDDSKLQNQLRIGAKPVMPKPDRLPATLKN